MVKQYSLTLDLFIIMIHLVVYNGLLLTLSYSDDLIGLHLFDLLKSQCLYREALRRNSVSFDTLQLGSTNLCPTVKQYAMSAMRCIVSCCVLLAIHYFAYARYVRTHSLV